MASLLRAVKRLRDRWILPISGTVSVRDLIQRFQPVPSGSMRSLLLKMNMLADVAEPAGGSKHPYYHRRVIGPYHVITSQSDGSHVDLRHVHLPCYGNLNTVAEAVRRFDARTAEFVRASTGIVKNILIFPVKVPEGQATPPALLELKPYNDGDRNIVRVRCLAALAYLEYFPYDRSVDRPDSAGKNLLTKINEAILGALPGYCGTFGAAPMLANGGKVALPGSIIGLPFGPIGALAGGIAGALFSEFIDAAESGEGNYDLDQMHILQIAYRYYDKLWPEAQEKLVNSLLATGRIHRPNEDDIVTSGRLPDDWARAGHITIGPKVFRIGETENHILQIHTARYLTNQLLYQSDHHPDHDNRRNGSAEDNIPTCMNRLLSMLQDFLMDDFSEYNAKSYQTETRNALRNLCSYAYDHEVRLAARMVLDYISAHVAVSSCDLRRMVPFRRRNEGKNTTLIDGYRLDISLLEWETGADPTAEQYAVQAGNLRAYETASVEGPWYHPDISRPWPWSIRGEGGDGMMEGLGDYRLPAPIHALFVNDMSRRFYQRLHRKEHGDPELTGQNADNMEIYAGSPSYLISAGGGLAGPAINPGLAAIADPSVKRSQLGIAMTTSFMPTGQSAGANKQNYARDLIQFGSFAETGKTIGNYGVAPDFAFGHWVWLPEWFKTAVDQTETNDNGVFRFVTKRPADGHGPGFYLAVYEDSNNQFAVMEAHDTWLFPELTYDDFKEAVLRNNRQLHLQNHLESQYTTVRGNHVSFVIWYDSGEHDIENVSFGAHVTNLDFNNNGDSRDSNDRIADASKTTGFLNGTIMNSSGDGLITVANPSLNQTVVLDMRDSAHPLRISETGEIEVAGSNNEVWVDFGWKGPNEGDFFHPFNTITAAAAAVADRGVIKIVPGWTTERPSFKRNKRIRLVAPIGNVSFGVR